MVRSFLLLLMMALAIGFSACKPETKAEVQRSSPTPTPYPLDPAKVEKAANVSFSTYSKEWPVGWLWVDPDEQNVPTPHDVKMCVLRVNIPSKKDLYGDNRTAPRYVKAITGDFQIETRVKFLPKENYQGAGLLIYKDDNNYMRFERAYGGIGGGADGLRMDTRQGDDYIPIVTPADIRTDAEEVELKVVRSGKTFTSYWRLDDRSEWREVGKFETDYPDTILAGLVACNTAREVTAEFQYIRLLPVLKKPAK